MTSKQVPWEDSEDYLLHLGTSWASQFSWNHPATIKVSGSTLDRSWCQGCSGVPCFSGYPARTPQDFEVAQAEEQQDIHQEGSRRFSCAFDCGHTRPWLRILKHGELRCHITRSPGSMTQRLSDFIEDWSPSLLLSAISVIAQTPTWVQGHIEMTRISSRHTNVQGYKNRLSFLVS